MSRAAARPAPASAAPRAHVYGHSVGLRRAVLVGAALIASQVPVSGEAAAEVAPPCDFRVTRPFDGQTAVPPSIEPELSRTPGCALFVTLKTTDGVNVPFDLEDEGGLEGKARVVPRAPLPNDTDFVLDLGNSPKPCGDDPGKVRFHTGGAPRLLQVSFKVFSGRVLAVALELSEPVAASTDFDADHIDIAPQNTTTPLDRTDAVDDQRRSLVRSFRDAKGQLPRADVTWVVRVRKSLPFATGATLTEEFELELVPDKSATYRWRGPDRICQDSASGGCHAAPGAQGQGAPATGASGVAALLLGLAAIVWVRRRQPALPRRS